jgi:hypothetical protein
LQLDEDAALHIVAAIGLHEHGLYAIEQEERTVKEWRVRGGEVPQSGIGEVALGDGRVGRGVRAASLIGSSQGEATI